MLMFKVKSEVAPLGAEGVLTTHFKMLYINSAVDIRVENMLNQKLGVNALDPITVLARFALLLGST